MFLEAVGTVSEGSIPASVYREAPVTAPSQPPRCGGGCLAKGGSCCGEKTKSDTRPATDPQGKDPVDAGTRSVGVDDTDHIGGA